MTLADLRRARYRALCRGESVDRPPSADLPPSSFEPNGGALSDAMPSDASAAEPADLAPEPPRSDPFHR